MYDTVLGSDPFVNQSIGDYTLEMTINLGSSTYTATGGTVPRSFADRASDVVNVKDFGAYGDGIHDDYAAIQAALDFALGSDLNPHGNILNKDNRPVFFPAGQYLTSGRLTVTNVSGGYIFGAGSRCTRISTTGAAGAGPRRRQRRDADQHPKPHGLEGPVLRRQRHR